MINFHDQLQRAANARPQGGERLLVGIPSASAMLPPIQTVTRDLEHSHQAYMLPPHAHSGALFGR